MNVNAAALVHVSRDPLGFSAGDANLYRYAGGNPISRTDPSGMSIVVPTLLLGGGVSECPFGAFDWLDPNGNYVTVPTWEGDIFVPPGGHYFYTAIWCDYCGPWVSSVSVYHPEYNIWIQTSCRLHFHIVEGYSPGPGYSDSWLDCILHPSKMGKAEYFQYGAYGMIAIGITGLTFIGITGIGSGVTLWGGGTAVGGGAAAGGSGTATAGSAAVSAAVKDISARYATRSAAMAALAQSQAILNQLRPGTDLYMFCARRVELMQQAIDRIWPIK